MLALHVGIRELMDDVSASSRGDPLSLSFLGSLRVRSHQYDPEPGFFPLSSLLRPSAVQPVRYLNRCYQSDVCAPIPVSCESE